PRPQISPNVGNRRGPQSLVVTRAWRRTMTTATKTTSHDEIRKWVEQRGGAPARVDAKGHKQGGGILRIDFKDPGGEVDEALEHISWDEFFRTFDENKL